MVEGLATYEETQGTAFGRGRNPDARMILRMAALEDAFLSEDRPVAGLDQWPAGQAAYLFGEAFLAHLSANAGPAVLPELARVHSGRVIPFLDEFTARKVTGSTFSALWTEWRASTRAASERAAEEIRARGLTPSHALTVRGVRQTAPRFSPDGHWIAYTDRDLTHFRSIRLVGRSGGVEHHVVKRNGGTSLAWTPDGRALVYDEPETFRFFRVRSDLRLFDLATRRARWITRGLRARDPDVSRDGRTVVFVRELGDRSDLALIRLDGTGGRDLTRSEAGTQWSSPRWSPSGDALVAARFLPGGRLDLVRVVPESGAVTPLTQDRARDLEPVWSPDGATVVFRSDRDGVSNLYSLRLADGALSRLTNVLGGAFTPDVSPDGRELAFADYSARGYDIHVMPFDPAGRGAAEPFTDPYPAVAAPPPATSAPDRPYRPGSLLLPRFWTPYFDRTSRETRIGAVSGGSDALFRHAWAAQVRYGTETDRLGGRLFYQYDRYRPTLTLSLEDKSDPAATGFTRSREAIARATLPVWRTLRTAQSVSLGYRRRRETLEDTATPEELDLGGLEVAWAISTARQFPYSISPVEGYRVRLAYVKESTTLGSDVSLGKVIGGRARLLTRVSRGRRPGRAPGRRRHLRASGLHAIVHRGRVPGRRVVRRRGHEPRRPARLSRRRLRRAAGSWTRTSNTGSPWRIRSADTGCCRCSCAICTAPSSWTPGTPGMKAGGGRTSRPRRGRPSVPISTSDTACRRRSRSASPGALPRRARRGCISGRDSSFRVQLSKGGC